MVAMSHVRDPIVFCITKQHKFRAFLLHSTNKIVSHKNVGSKDGIFKALELV